MKRNLVVLVFSVCLAGMVLTVAAQAQFRPRRQEPAKQHAKSGEFDNFVARLLRDEYESLDGERERIVKNRRELDGLYQAVAQKTNALLDASEREKRAIEAEIRELTAAYNSKLQSIEASQQKLRDRINKFEADKERLEKAEAEIGFATPYTPQVIRVRDRQTNRPTASTSSQANSSLADTTWTEYSSDAGGKKLHFQLRFHSGGRVTCIEPYDSGECYTYSSSWSRSGNQVHVRTDTPGQDPFTLQGNRMYNRYYDVRRDR